MAVLYVRVPDDFHDAVKAQAAAEGRSIANMALRWMRLGQQYAASRPQSWTP